MSSNNKYQSTTTGGNYTNRQSTKNAPHKNIKRMGKIEALGSHMFDVNQDDSSLYQETKTQIEEYVTTHYQDGVKVAKAMNAEEDYHWASDFPEPRVLEDDEPEKPETPDEPPENATDSAKSRYKSDKDKYDEAMKEYKEEYKVWEANKRQNDLYNKKKLDQYMEAEVRYHQNCDQVYGDILGQCTKAMRNKLEQSENWDKIKKEHKPIPLLKEIRKICQNYQDNKYPMVTIVQSQQQLWNIKQGSNEGLIKYKNRLENQLEITETHYDEILPVQYYRRLPGYSDASDADKKTMRQKAADQLIAFIFLQGTNERSKELLTHLSNSYANGQDLYPKTLDAAVTAITNYKSIGKSGKRPYQPDDDKSHMNQNNEHGQAHYTQGNKKQKIDHDEALCDNCKSIYCPVSTGETQQCDKPNGYGTWTRNQKQIWWMGNKVTQQGNSHAQH